MKTSANYHVLLGARNIKDGQKAVADLLTEKEIFGTAETVQLDVRDDTSIDMAAAYVTDQYGYIDVLINNAGINEAKNFNMAPRDQLRSMLLTNTLGPLSVAEAFLPLLLKSPAPRLIFVSSSMGSISHAADPNGPYYRSRVKIPGYEREATEYRISKAGLNMMIVQYHKLLAKKGVKVHGADPGVVVTDFFDRALAEKHGAPGADVGGNTVAEVVKGERDADVGRVVGRYGVSPW
jgi:NAD(P)-dependent dehydrogenase (short-subunit alcohol dehydrogenase family)